MTISGETPSYFTLYCGETLWQGEYNYGKVQRSAVAAQKSFKQYASQICIQQVAPLKSAVATR